MTDRDYRFLPENEDRPVLVLGHSLGTTFSLWNSIFESLQKNFRLLFFNPHPRQIGDDDASIAGRAKELIQIVEHLKLDQVDFCGVSMSGLIGQWLALEAPDRVRNLVLANTAARIGNPESWQERMNLIRGKGLAQVASDLVSRWFSNSFITQQPNAVQTYPCGHLACIEFAEEFANAVSDFLLGFP